MSAPERAAPLRLPTRRRPSPCPSHRWLLETPSGATVAGHCRRAGCGATREFPASIDRAAAWRPHVRGPSAFTAVGQFEVIDLAMAARTFRPETPPRSHHGAKEIS